MNEVDMLFESFRAVFSFLPLASFIHFQALMVSLWALPVITGGGVSLARIWLASRTAHHWDGLLRFVRRSRWGPDDLAQALTLLGLTTACDHLPIGAGSRPWLLVGVDERARRPSDGEEDLWYLHALSSERESWPKEVSPRPLLP